MQKVDKIISTILGIACAILMAVMMCVIFAEVCCRYVGGFSITWSEELCRYTFVWITFLGLPLGQAQGKHVALDILVNALHGVPRKILQMFIDLFTIFLGVVMVISCYKFSLIGYGSTSASLHIPMAYVYYVLLAGSVAFVYFALRGLYINLRAPLVTEEQARQARR